MNAMQAEALQWAFPPQPAAASSAQTAQAAMADEDALFGAAGVPTPYPAVDLNANTGAHALPRVEAYPIFGEGEGDATEPEEDEGERNEVNPANVPAGTA